MAELGVALVGTAFGCFAHLPALRRAGLEVRALVGRDPERTRKRAELLGIPRASTSLAEALAPGDVEVVAISTPPHSHADLVLEAVRAGCHVVCEKPLARDAAEARQLRDAAEAAGVIHLMGHEFRFEPDQALLARVIEQGEIGTPLSATFVMNAPAFADPEVSVPDWWRDAAQGGGWLQGFAIHAIDQVRRTLGEFAGVSAAVSVPDWPGWSAELAYHVRFRLRSGVDGVMQSNGADWGPPLNVSRIVGSGGTAWIENGRVLVANRSGTREIPVPPELDLSGDPPPELAPAELVTSDYDRVHASGVGVVQFTRLYRHLAARIRNGGESDDSGPRPATFADGAAGMEVLDAIRASARDGRWVDIETASTLAGR